MEVVRHVARGLPNQEIARLLSISERTAAHHIQHRYGVQRVEKSQKWPTERLRSSGFESGTGLPSGQFRLAGDPFNTLDPIER
ncbi:MAG: helix-turn-helix domain-containing protein [Dehalococcoidia bacterium]